MSYFLDLFSSLYFLAVRTKNIMDEPGGRKIHATNVPTLGGVGLFASFALSLIIFGISINLTRPDLISLLSLIGATLILLFLGMQDDLIAIPPKKKLVAQSIASAIVIFVTDVRIVSFDGLLGLGELPYTISVVFTFFVFILVINAFNLIDGIDGLAGSIALIGSCTLGIFFLQNEQSLLALICFILIGSTLGFLTFNLSNNPIRKLFMGDSGSMFIGFLLAYLGISFLKVNTKVDIPMPAPNAPIMLLAILSFPLLDTLRVFTIRAMEKRSPFSPDRNHIHHRLLHLGLSHKQSTSFIVACNWLIIGVVFLVSELNINIQLAISVGVAWVLYLSPFFRGFKEIIAFKTLRTPNLKNPQESHKKKNTYVSDAYLSTDKISKIRPIQKISEPKESLVDLEDNPNLEVESEKVQRMMDKRMELLKKTSFTE